MYKAYGFDNFETLVVDKETDPMLYKFIEESKKRTRFSNYTAEQLEQFLKRIYELRENNSNNPT